MIVVDANLLIYAYDSASAQHKRSVDWLEKVFSGQEVVGLPWQNILTFLRVITNLRLSAKRVEVETAVQIVEGWMQQPNVQVIAPGDGHWAVLRRMVAEGSASGPLVSDAEIAALTIEYGGVLYTADRDFARFPGLRWKNPLR